MDDQYPEPPRNEGEPLTRYPVPTHQDYPDLHRGDQDANTRYLEPLTAPPYQEHFPHVVLEHARQGLTLDGIVARLGITRPLMVHWVETHEAFAEAVGRAQVLAKTWWEDQLRAQAMEGNTSATQFAMKNQFPDDYRDRKEVTVDERRVVHLDFTGTDGEEALDGEWSEVDEQTRALAELDE